MEKFLENMVRDIKRLVIVNLLFSGLAVLFIALALIFFFQSRKYLQESYAAEGRVVRFDQKAKLGGTAIGYVVVRFADRSGTVQELYSNIPRFLNAEEVAQLLRTDYYSLYHREGDNYFTEGNIAAQFPGTFLCLALAALTVTAIPFLTVAGLLGKLIFRRKKKNGPGESPEPSN